jgi:hypothetical protein
MGTAGVNKFFSLLDRLARFGYIAISRKRELVELLRQFTLIGK